MDIGLQKRTTEACAKIPGFKTVLEEFRKSILVNGLSKNTFTNYARNLAQLSLRFNKLPRFINDEEINNYLAELMQGSRSASHSEFKHAVYSFRYYFKMIGKSTEVKLPKIKHERRLPVVLSKEECKSMFELTSNIKHRLILMLMYSGGLRVNELVNLKWSDLDVDRMTLMIRRSKGRKDRYVPLSSYLLEYLITFAALGNISEYLFVGSVKNAKMSREAVRFLMNRAVKRAGIVKSGVCLHTLRHSFATHLLEDGLDIVSIKELLGHSRIESTLTYLHVGHQLQRKRISPLDTLFVPGSDHSLAFEKERYYRVIANRIQKQRFEPSQLDIFEGSEMW